MKIKIGSDGTLFIERAGEYKNQWCPFTVAERAYWKCGDWCSLFGEPELYAPDTGNKDRIQICQNRILFGEIIDERVKP